MTTTNRVWGRALDRVRGRVFRYSSKLTDAHFAYLLVIPLLVFLLAVVAYPIAYSFWISLHEFNLAIGVRTFVGVGQYVRAFQDPKVLNALTNTIMYTVEVTIFSLAVSLAAALLLNEAFRGKRLLTTIVILPWAVSTYATAIIWRYLYSADVGLFNALLLRLGLTSSYINMVTQTTALPFVAIAHTWQVSPLGIYFFLSALQVIPADLYKVAKLDKLGPARRFMYVTFPYLRYPMLIVLALVTVEAARVFDIFYFLTGGGPGNASTTLPYEIYKQSFVNLNIGYGSAISYILLLLIMIMTVVYFLILMRRGME